ncbi:hypothetical protein OIU78_023267, partial [Salix suchowensis]
MFRQIRSPCRY